MKRVLLVIIVVMLLAGLATWIADRPGASPLAPRFVAGAPAEIASYKWDHYDWSAPVPFMDHKVWMWTASGTNSHSYLYDLEQRVVVGELFNAGMPVLWNKEGSKILCEGRDPLASTFKQRVVSAIGRLTGRQVSPGNRTETFWVLDLKNNSTTRLGSVFQYPGSGSGWRPSPGFRRGYTVPSTASGRSFFLCDLEANTIAEIAAQGEPKGWWDNKRILMETGVNDFALYDVDSRKREPVFGPGDIESFLAGAGLTNKPGGLGVFAAWNGKEYDFYFGPKGDIFGLSATISFLVKADKEKPALRLLYGEFRYRWGGHLDADATHYLFQGETSEPGKAGDGGVYLRNLTNGTVLTLVAPDNKGRYAIPRFYGQEVIYFRDRFLRRVKLDGTGDAEVFPSSPVNK